MLKKENKKKRVRSKYDLKINWGEIGSFKLIIECIKEAKDDFVIDFKEDEMHIQIITLGGVMLLDVHIPSSKMVNYEFNRPHTIGFNSKNLYDDIKSLPKDANLTLIKEDSTNEFGGEYLQLLIKINENENINWNIPVIYITGQDSIYIIKEDYTKATCIEFDCKKFKQMLTLFRESVDSVKFLIKNGNFIIEAERKTDSDGCWIFKDILEDKTFEYEDEFARIYLKIVSYACVFSDKMVIKFLKEFPIVFYFENNEIIINYTVAPKI